MNCRAGAWSRVRTPVWTAFPSVCTRAGWTQEHLACKAHRSTLEASLLCTTFVHTERPGGRVQMQVSSKPHLEKQWDDALSFHLIFTYYLHISKCKITSSLSQFRWFRVWISLRVMVKRNASLRTSSWLPLRNTFFISFSISWNKRSNIMVWLLTSPQTVLTIVTTYGLPWSVYIYLMFSPGYSLPPSWPSLSFPHSVQILVSYQLLKTWPLLKSSKLFTRLLYVLYFWFKRFPKKQKLTQRCHGVKGSTF